MAESFVDLSLGKIPMPVSFDGGETFFRLSVPGTITLDQMYKALALQDTYPELFGGFQKILDKTKMTAAENAVLRAEMIEVMQIAYNMTEAQARELGDLLLVKGVTHFLVTFDFSLIASSPGSPSVMAGKVVPMKNRSNGAQPSPNSSRHTPVRPRKTG